MISHVATRTATRTASLRTAVGRPAGDQTIWLIGASLLLWMLVLRVADPGSVAEISNFVLVFLAVAVEALPFVLLGAAVSAGIAVFVSDRAFGRISRLPVRLQMPAAIAGSLAFPVCECGSVPVARRLLLRGMHPSAALTFMLAAPVLNPVVLFSTYVAYQGRAAPEMVIGRAGVGMIVAVVAGLAIGRRSERLLSSRSQEHEHGHDHSHESRGKAFVGHLTGDLFFMGKFVVAGAALAAMMQTAVPRSVIEGVTTAPQLAALLLMGFAFLLSLCSEADAFVAISFTDFPLSSQLAFLTFGPVIDIKLALLYAATFGWAFVGRITAVTAGTVLVAAMAFHALIS